MTCRGKKGRVGKCPDCGGTGAIRITQCPLKAVRPDTWEILEYVELYLEHGLPPAAGGQLDQAKGFLQAARFVSNEKAKHKARLKI
ncbi:MAG: hypothetical protein ABII09_03560 [Planctomycetota bacterium]